MRRLFRSCRLRVRKKTLCRSNCLAYSPADLADECSKLHYCAEKDRLVRLMWFWVFGFRLRKSARSAGDTGGSCLQIDRVLLRVILPQIAQMTQRNAASCINSKKKIGQCTTLVHCPYRLYKEANYASSGIVASSSAFFVVLRIVRLARFGFSSEAGLSVFTPASSGSIMILPQYSQTMIFL